MPISQLFVILLLASLFSSSAFSKDIEIDPFKIPRQSLPVKQDIYTNWSNGERWVLADQLATISQWQESQLQYCRNEALNDCKSDFAVNDVYGDITYHAANDHQLCQHVVSFCNQRVQNDATKGRSLARKKFEQAFVPSLVFQPKTLDLSGKEMDVLSLYQSLQSNKNVPAFLRNLESQETESDLNP